MKIFFIGGKIINFWGHITNCWGCLIIYMSEIVQWQKPIRLLTFQMCLLRVCRHNVKDSHFDLKEAEYHLQASRGGGAVSEQNRRIHG